MSGLDSLSISPDDRRKFEQFMEDGLKALQEIEDIKGGLKDTTKALAEEYGLESKLLTAALRTVFKNNLADKKTEMEGLETVLHITGRG